ncbi:MAG TPA: ATP-binding cassette domain-containing protein [Candidatus Paceibacterota bacterium]|nr:ATP-binding cassette domain-containing protein [Candidatus Paceibacterota bacterium]
MISFTNVSLIYPTSTKTIFEDLSFTISEGELVLVMGATGSGKSSLLRLINGLIPHHTGGILAGDISVNGISTREVKPGGLAHLIGIVGQNPINGFVTDKVEEELAFGMEALNLPPDIMRKRVEEVLDLLSLAHLRNRSIATLSGGEQQRVAIGSALVMHPKVLVLDEPTSALDPIAAEEVLSILHRLVQDLGLTVVISEHKLERVIQFADRILYIKGGGQAEIGSPETILQTSEIAPPIVHLARALDLPAISLTVRDMRRSTEALRRDISIPNTQSDQMPHSEVISIRGISLSYANTKALDNISLSIGGGEIITIMGRNGAGKSTLLKSIAGILKPTQGQISVLGNVPSSLHGKERRMCIGFIPQEPSDLLYGQSVLGECATADRDNEIDKGSTFELLKSLVPGISPNTHPRDLSEGQRLALALSVVLSSNPKILILDEPTRGLDYSAKNSLVATLNATASRGCAVILATHDVELVAEVATRVVFIADGEIVADGRTVDVLLSSPAFAPQVAKIMSPAPWLTVKNVVDVLELSKPNE